MMVGLFETELRTFAVKNAPNIVQLEQYIACDLPLSFHIVMLRVEHGRDASKHFTKLNT